MDTCILELGTRTVRLLRASLSPSGMIETHDIRSERVAIGESIDVTGTIARSTSLEAFAVVARLVDTARVECRGVPLYAIAPHELGFATNAQSFLDALAKRTRVSATLLGARDTARLCYRAARADLGAFESQAAIVHLGDAAIDLASGTRATLDFAETLDFGVARLHRAFGAPERGLPAIEASALFSLVRLCGGPSGRRIREWGAPVLLVTSENAAAVRTVARAWGFIGRETEPLGRLELHALAAEIVGARLTDLRDAGVDPERAWLVGTTAVVIDAVSELLGQREVFLGASGTSEGVALEVLGRPALRLASGA